MSLSNHTINNANIVYNTALSYGANDKAARIITGQAMNESGNFTSSLFMRSNNAFGMNMPTIRPHPHILRKDSFSNYAAYASLQDSVKDLIDWLHYSKIDFNNVQSSDDYVAQLKNKNYFGAPLNNYQIAVRNLMNAVGSYLKNNSLMIIAIIAAGIFVTFLI